MKISELKINKLASELVENAKHLNGWVNAVSMGIDNTGATNVTQALQGLHDTYDALYLPTGTYLIDNFILRTGKSIIGDGKEKTILKADVSSIANFFDIDSNPVQNCSVENITLLGNDGNLNQNGLYLVAKYPSIGYQHGGLWQSKLKNISIRNFNGVAFGLKSPAGVYLPIQANLFEQLYAYGKTGYDTCQVQGQVEQNTFLRCHFDANNSSNNACLHMSRCFVVDQYTNNPTAGYVDMGGHQNTFVGCYFGSGKYGVQCERTWQSTIIGGYFENCALPVYATTVTQNLTLVGCDFAAGSTLNGNDICTDDMTSSISIVGTTANASGACIYSSSPECKNEYAPLSYQDSIKDGGTIYSKANLYQILDNVTINSLISLHDDFYLKILSVSAGKTATITHGTNLFTDTKANYVIDNTYAGKYFMFHRIADTNMFTVKLLN